MGQVMPINLIFLHSLITLCLLLTNVLPIATVLCEMHSLGNSPPPLVLQKREKSEAQPCLSVLHPANFQSAVQSVTNGGRNPINPDSYQFG